MSTNQLNRSLLLLLVVSIFAQASILLVNAADADPLQDFCVADFSKDITVNGFPCKKYNATTTEDFIFSDLRQTANTSLPPFAGAVFGSVFEYPGLNTLGLSIARLDFAVGGLIPPHTHPRASEIIYVVKGRMYAGFVDNNNKVYARVISKGDVMIFPRGLIHWQLNVGKTTATGIVTLNGQFPGFQLIANSMFGSSIRDEVLEKTFFLDQKTVKQLKAVFGGSS